MPFLETHIEAILFYVTEPMSVGELACLFACTTAEIEIALTALDAALAERGVRLVRIGESVELRAAREAAPLIEKLRQDELSRELSRASLETLAVVLYQGPVTRSEIEYIRGVQSQSSIRLLAGRGLIQKISEYGSKRGTFYRATTEALAHVGLSRVEELPDYEKTQAVLKQNGREEVQAF
ncbi:MAG: SMC-Scp complex subunit ScpB [bacterium]|nr:SMC-Scp complex subunit ScpB [bacterium]MDZ4284727.1 SMC-Scp complex subunit ScpB [Patescibacteria group bacterium]